MSTQQLIMDWYQANKRDLPWRKQDVTPWQILVSEIMLQQTPANRVAPAWQEWIARWPDAVALSKAPTSEVLRQWGRLGYPNRALRLQATAREVVARHNGELPRDEDSLLKLPGIGEYTAAAIVAFAYRRKSVVLDTNVRRVISRVWHGQDRTKSHLTNIERTFAQNLVPEENSAAALWSISVMEFGALVCTARSPKCDSCIINQSCAWLQSGQPQSQVKPKATKFEGTDRQARGAIMAKLRQSQSAVSKQVLAKTWTPTEQRERALQSLITDGLVVQNKNGSFELPT